MSASPCGNAMHHNGYYPSRSASPWCNKCATRPLGGGVDPSYNGSSRSGAFRRSESVAVAPTRNCDDANPPMTSAPLEPNPVTSILAAAQRRAIDRGLPYSGAVTPAEAGTLLGGPAAHKAGPSSDASNGSGVVVTKNLCEWDLITSDQLGHDLWVAVYAGAERAYFNDAVTHEAPIPGLGDAATGDSIHVYVISKGTVLQIYGSLPASDGLRQAAAIAIGKL